jgi:hypothetical protein
MLVREELYVFMFPKCVCQEHCMQKTQPIPHAAGATSHTY